MVHGVGHGMQAHVLERGDAILFRSEKHHHVTTVKVGVRHSLVIEMWVRPENIFDRES